MIHRFEHLRNFLGCTFFQAWDEVHDSESRAVAAVTQDVSAEPLLQIGREIEALLRESMTDDELDQYLRRELWGEFSPRRAGQGPRRWLTELASDLTERVRERLSGSEGVLRYFLDRAFPSGWATQAESPGARVEGFVRGASPELLRALAGEIDAMLTCEPTRAGCERFLRDVLKSCYIPRERDGGAHQWLQQVRRAALRGQGRSVL